jgi:hypothetical protein
MKDFLPIGLIQTWFVCNNLSQCVNNGVYIAKKESDVLSYIINEFINTPSCSLKTEMMKCIQVTTGPGVFNKAINKYIKENNDTKNVVFLPYQFLEPCVTNKCFITGETYVVHKHELSWCDNISINMTKVYIFCPQFSNFFVSQILLCILFLIPIIIFKIIRKRRTML